MKPYDRVLAIAKLYLGPAAESFLARQCPIAVKTEAPAITPAHFKAIAKWVETSACRFIDRPKAEEMARKISALTA